MSDAPYEMLSPDVVMDAVESVGFLSDARLFPLNSYENRVYQVGIEGDTPLIAKFYRPGRWTEAQILEEHAFSHELVAADISVVAPIQCAGGSLHEHGGFHFALFPRRGGYPPELEDTDSLRVLGRTLGRIHSIGRARPFTERPPLSLDRFVCEARTFLLKYFIPGELRPHYETLTRDLLTVLESLLAEMTPEDSIRLHGDCHVGNILWRDASAHFVDLDDCCTGPAVQDLWMLLSGERHEREIQLSILLEGYTDFADFEARQLRWIEALRTMRLVHYAAWLGRRWGDPAFPRSFTWFNTQRYWADHILELREQLAALEEPPLRLL